MTDHSAKHRFYEEILGIPKPHAHQIHMWELIERDEFPLILKAPTGSGKTEAVIAPFLNQFMTGKFHIAPRLIYVLPMRVLVNTLTERIRRYANKVSPYITVFAHHGDNPHAPFFIYDIVVTTLDQFLYAFVRASKQVGRHIDVPVGAIASSLVIFDEAHMYRDEFTFSIMRALLEILHNSKIPFIVMTATMPQTLHESLFEQIPIKGHQCVVANVSERSNVNIKLSVNPLFRDDEPQIDEDIIEKIRNKKTLIVVNQVRRAQILYSELTRRLENHPITLLHSRFTRLDRQRHEENALKSLARKEDGAIISPPKPAIVISTQVLEAGVDFSAELLITELAPSDSLIQRIGRCARYGEVQGEVIIYPVDGERSFMPYEKSNIEKTSKWLNENLRHFNPGDYGKVMDFINDTLDYKANDYEATDTLLDLYECVLFADEEPQHITLRKNKSAKVVIVEPLQTSRRQNMEVSLENGIRKILSEGKIGDHSFEADVKTLWKWFNDGILSHELTWKGDGGGFSVVNIRERGENIGDERKIIPYKTYIIDKTYYNERIGVKGDEAEFI